MLRQDQKQFEEDQGQDLPVLPVDVLTKTLQQVPLRERLSSCSLVCSSWAAAAAATSVHLEVELSSCIRWGHVLGWLRAHAGQATSINLTHQGHTKQRIELLCSKLLQLEQLSINNMAVHVCEESGDSCDNAADGAVLQLPVLLMEQAVVSPLAHDDVLNSSSTESMSAQPVASTHSPAGDSQSGLGPPIAGCSSVAAAARAPFLPKLRELKLFDCRIAVDHLQQLSKLSALTCLEVYSCSFAEHTHTSALAQEQLATEAMTAALAGLTALQELTLALLDECSMLALASVRHMQRLQRLQLILPDDGDDPDMFPAALPPSLIGLTLLNTGFVPSPAVSAQLSRLTALRELQLDEADFNPCALAQWTQLQRLELNSVYFTAPVVSCAVLNRAGLNCQCQQCCRQPRSTVQTAANVSSSIYI